MINSFNTIFIIAITSIISIIAFKNNQLFDKLKFNSYMIWHKKEYGRMFSHALIHGSWIHLAVNMFVLWQFGSGVENAFKSNIIFPYTAKYGSFMFMLMYVTAIVASSLISLIKYKDKHSYNAVGASGAVSAVAFSFILLAPNSPLNLLFIPIDFPAYAFGLAYLAYSYYMSKKDIDNVAHEAHFAGAVFGIIFPLILNYRLGERFIYIIFN